jgi:hypothetical protein
MGQPVGWPEERVGGVGATIGVCHCVPRMSALALPRESDARLERLQRISILIACGSLDWTGRRAANERGSEGIGESELDWSSSLRRSSRGVSRARRTCSDSSGNGRTLGPASSGADSPVGNQRSERRAPQVTIADYRVDT